MGVTDHRWAEARREMEHRLHRVRMEIRGQEEKLARLHEQEEQGVAGLRQFDEAVNVLNQLPEDVVGLIQGRARRKRTSVLPPEARVPETVSVTVTPVQVPVVKESKEKPQKKQRGKGGEGKYAVGEAQVKEVYELLHWSSPATMESLKSVTGLGEFAVGQVLRQLRKEGKAVSRKQEGGMKLEWFKEKKQQGAD